MQQLCLASIPSIEISILRAELDQIRSLNETMAQGLVVNNSNVGELCTSIQMYQTSLQSAQILTTQLREKVQQVELSFQRSAEPIQRMTNAVNQHVITQPSFLAAVSDMKHLDDAATHGQVLKILEILPQVSTTIQSLPAVLPCIVELNRNLASIQIRVKNLLLERGRKIDWMEWDMLRKLSRQLDLPSQREFESCVAHAQIDIYARQFPASKTISTAELHARFDFLRKMMDQIPNQEPEFHHLLAQGFCNVTRDVLDVYLRSTTQSMTHILSLWKMTSRFEKETEKSAWPLRGLISSAFLGQLDKYLSHEKQALDQIVMQMKSVINTDALFLHIKHSLETAREINLPGGSILFHLLSEYTNAILKIVNHYRPSGPESTPCLLAVNICDSLEESTLTLLQHYETIHDPRHLSQITECRDRLLLGCSEVIAAQLTRYISAKMVDFLVLRQVKPHHLRKEHSKWIDEFFALWEKLLPEPKSTLTEISFNIFLVKFVKAFMAKEEERLNHEGSPKIWDRQPSLNEDQASMWLLDLAALKDIFVRHNGGSKSRYYYQTIESAFKPIVSKLQILSSSYDHFISSFRLLGGVTEDIKANTQALKLLMNIRGFSKEQQSQLLVNLHSNKK